VLSVAKDRGKIAVNVCERGGRIYESDRSEIVWTAEDIRVFCVIASVELQAALLLALWTGQRQGYLLRLTWKDYDGTYIGMRQSKGRGSKGRRRESPRRLRARVLHAAGERPRALAHLTESLGIHKSAFW
jgi:integrase